MVDETKENRCFTCNHLDHKPGDCKNCNCGQSEMVHRNPLANGYCARDQEGRLRLNSGFRVGKSRREDEDV